MALARLSLSVILTLALGIGANAAVFSVVHGTLLRPMPYHAPTEIFSVVFPPSCR